MSHSVDNIVVPVPTTRPSPLPGSFDGKRMFWGGFKSIVEA